MKVICFVVLLGIFAGASASGSAYVRAVVESCSGCSLKRLPDVKQFIFEDLPLYDRTEFKHIQGAVPELVLYDNNNEEVERLQLSRLTREECNDLLQAKGFPRNKRSKDEI
ncbi:selenoprotein M-like [Fopius arisanus]|uniref:Selenoprotein M n=1 Tax=Fopius arisanus TaxID=64838 RepID=A0A9R1U4M4_9HYME|nr:PREDICTED: selenoprotein M-like [Fopius arisanus]